MMSRGHRLVCVLSILACGCGRVERGPAVIVSDGMDRLHAWKLEGCVMEGGVLVQQQTPDGSPAMAMLLLPPLPDTGSLLLTVRARSDHADSLLCIDLWGFGQDDPAQQLCLAPGELDGDFITESTVLPSGSPGYGIWLRIFSSSTRPIEVDYVELAYLPSDLSSQLAAPSSQGRDLPTP